MRGPLCNFSLAQQGERSKGNDLLPTVPLLHVLKELMFLLIFCVSAGCALSGSTADGFAGGEHTRTAEIPQSWADGE